jgi:hypothetical protein
MKNFQKSKNGIYAPSENCRNCGRPIKDELESDEAQRRRKDTSHPVCAVCRVKKGVTQERLNKDAERQKEKEEKTEQNRISEIAQKTQELAPAKEKSNADKKSFNI